MSNVLLVFINIIVTFSLVILVEKLFKKEGLYVWMAIALIMANILECKTINLLGFASTTGNVLFASVYLATDIMCEKYGKGFETSFLLLKPAALIICSFATLFDTVTAMFGSYIVAVKTKNVEHHKVRNFI